MGLFNNESGEEGWAGSVGYNAAVGAGAGRPAAATREI